MAFIQGLGLPPRSATLSLLSGAADPTAGAGLSAPIGATYARSSGGVGTIYLKTGAADTAWTLLVTQTFAGNITAPRFLGSTAGSAAAPTFSWSDDPNTGPFNEAADNFAISAGGVRYQRVRSAGVEVLNTTFNAQSQVIFANVLTPTTLAANANDYNPTGLSGATSLLLAASTPVTVTGIATGAMGRLLCLFNTSANTITLAHASESSAVANRLLLPTGNDLELLTGQGVMLVYSGSESRWRALAWGEPNIV